MPSPSGSTTSTSAASGLSVAAALSAAAVVSASPTTERPSAVSRRRARPRKSPSSSTTRTEPVTPASMTPGRGQSGLKYGQPYPALRFSGGRSRGAGYGAARAGGDHPGHRHAARLLPPAAHQGRHGARDGWGGAPGPRRPGPAAPASERAAPVS